MGHTGTRRTPDDAIGSAGDWTCDGPGRLCRGRSAHVLADIESYLEFFAIAGAD